MSETLSLVHHFLVAMPGLQEGSFADTVVYICEHNEEGAFGLIINRPLGNMDLGQILEQLNLTPQNQEKASNTPIMYGGPLRQERGFVLHYPCGDWRSNLSVEGKLDVTTSQDILEKIAVGEGPDQILIALGYSGWGPKQLDEEVMNNAWLTCPAPDNLDIIFDRPIAERRNAVAKLIGVDLAALVDSVGHA